MSRAHHPSGVDVAVVPADGLLDTVRAHLPERDPSFVWAPDPGPDRGGREAAQKTRARTGRTSRLRLMVKDLEDPRRTEPPKDGLGEREMLEAWLEFHRTTLLSSAKALTITRGRRVPWQPPGSHCTAWSA